MPELMDVVPVPCSNCRYPNSRVAVTSHMHECCLCGHAFSREKAENRTPVVLQHGEMCYVDFSNGNVFVFRNGEKCVIGQASIERVRPGGLIYSAFDLTHPSETESGS